MNVEILYPNYKLYGPYIRKSDNRCYYVLAEKDMYGKIPKNGYKKSILKSRLMVELFENRILSPKEHVDHIDGDLTNDVLENLQILDYKSHASKDSIRLAIENNLIKKQIVKCPCCQNTFLCKKFRIEIAKVKNHNVCCSRKCSSKYYGANQHKNWSIGEKVSEES